MINQFHDLNYRYLITAILRNACISREIPERQKLRLLKVYTITSSICRFAYCQKERQRRIKKEEEEVGAAEHSGGRSWKKAKSNEIRKRVTIP